MGWLQKKVLKWSTGKRINEASHFVSMLSVMDGEEIGMTVAVATDFRHKLFDSGIHVMEPSLTVTAVPGAVYKITSTINALQKSGNMVDAAGLMVWAHTLRGAESLEVRGIARKMWGELSRGFPYTLNAKYDFFSLSGILLNIDGYDEYPSGFTPTPL